jgi:hypothetical protein
VDAPERRGDPDDDPGVPMTAAYTEIMRLLIAQRAAK